MKNTLRVILPLSFLLFFVLSFNVIESKAANYDLKTYKMTTRDDTLKAVFTGENDTYGVDLYAEVDGEEYDFYCYRGTCDVDFSKTFPVDTNIKLFITYKKDNEVIKEYLKTITVENPKPYVIETFEIGDKDDYLSYTLKNIDTHYKEVYAEVNGEKYVGDDDFESDYNSDLIYDAKKKIKGSFEFGKKFKAGTKIKLYIIRYGDIEEYLKTIIVEDETPPKLSVPSINLRTGAINVTTEEDATITATYGGKKVKAVKKSNTLWQIKLSKLKVGKKLVVTAKDKAHNSKVVTKKTTAPNGVYIYLNKKIKTTTRTATGTITKGITTDKVYLIIDSKKYKGKIKNGKFSVKIPTIKARKYVKAQLYDKYGNLLDTSNKVRVYTTEYARIGMTKKQVLDSDWGKPDRINRTIYSSTVYEQWVYDDYDTYFYFENGKLTSIQD